MKTAYIVRYGAYGDHCHMTNILKALDELGYHITFEYNNKGIEMHQHNPRVDIHLHCEPSLIKGHQDTLAFKKRHDRLKHEYDLYCNLSGSLEDALIAPEHSSEYFWPLSMRRAKNSQICYYDQSMKWIGLTDKKYMGWCGEIYFPRKDHERIKNFLCQFKSKFIILIAMRGTMWQKAVYPIIKHICDEWLRKYAESAIITTGDDFCRQWEWEHPCVFHKSGRMPYRDALLMSRYVDLVLTPETGLGVGAGAYGTPKIMLLAAASLKNIVDNDKNDFSLQSDAYCSPCNRAIYNTNNCPTTEFENFKVQGQKVKLPICVNFDPVRVLNRMQEIYDCKFERKWTGPGTYEGTLDTEKVFM